MLISLSSLDKYFFFFEKERIFAKMESRFDGKTIVVTGAGQGIDTF